MSSFLNKGQRLQTKKAKKHVKEFYKILGELDTIAEKISRESKVEITEDNINEIASKYTNRTIDNMEKMILMAKLSKYGTDISDKEE
jgi:hypothetical protein